MSTPTTMKCQIAVPSDGNGDTETICNLTLTPLVEGVDGGDPVPPGPGMPIEDPHPGGMTVS